MLSSLVCPAPPARSALARRTALALCIGLALLGCTPTVAGPSPDLRLRRVVLYQNGIGYFERSGYMEGGRLRLSFREREVDDVLKSIVVVEEGLDLSREKPSTVNVRLLDNEAKRAPEAVSTLDLLLSRQVSRRVSIAYATPTAAWKATYRIILPKADATDKRALLQAWALIDNVSDEDWTGVNLSLATGAPLSFASDLRTPRFVHRPDAANLYAGEPASGPVLSEHGLAHQEVDHDGDGIPDSVDKCPDQPETHNGMEDEDGCPDHGKVVVQSNSLTILQQVHFTSGSDTVGKDSAPILDQTAAVLKSNHTIRRMIIEGHASRDEKDGWGISSRRAGAVRAALLSRGVTTELVTQAFADTRPLGDEAGRNRRVEFRIAETESDEQAKNKHAGVAQASSLAHNGSAATLSHEIAGSMRYDIGDTVSIPKHASSLVTIVNEFLPGEEVLLFRPDSNVRESNRRPFRAARLTSPGALGLQPGSVAIFSGGSFVGEGILARLNPGETVLIPYALDAATDVRTTEEHTDAPSRIVSVARGQLTVEDIATRVTRYAVTPGKDVPTKLVIRHERRAGYVVDALPPGTESTPDTHLVPLPLTPSKPSELVVTETWKHERQITAADTASATLSLYLHGSKLPADVDQMVRDLMKARADMDKATEAVDALRVRIADAGARAGELRESLRALEKTRGADALQKELTQHLSGATKDMESLSRQVAENQLTLATSRAVFGELTRKLRAVGEH